MRSRGAGVIGARVYPLYGSASGVWNLGECFQWRKEDTWPRLSLSIYQITSPVDATASLVDTTITATITSTYPAVSYRWEKSTNGGATWSVVAGQTTESITLTGLGSANDGDMYRLVATAGIRTQTSNSVTVWRDTIASVSWSTQPDSITVYPGEVAYFYSVVTATGALHGSNYTTFSSGANVVNQQWQQSTNGGSTWSDMVGSLGYYIGIYPVVLSMNGYKYRAKATIAGADYYSNVATLTV